MEVRREEKRLAREEQDREKAEIAQEKFERREARRLKREAKEAARAERQARRDAGQMDWINALVLFFIGHRGLKFHLFDLIYINVPLTNIYLFNNLHFYCSYLHFSIFLSGRIGEMS